MWRPLAKSTRLTTEIKTFNNMGYPTSLKEKKLAQITNIYSKLIFPGQYIPHIYTEGNMDRIHQCGDHVSEVHRAITQYTRSKLSSTPQHCRHYGKLVTIMCDHV
jgi:hypothetical protein